MAKKGNQAPQALPDGEAQVAAAGMPTKPNPELTAEQIKEARARARLTQAELAEELDVSTRTVARWESGEARPSEAQKRRILEGTVKLAGAGVAAVAARALMAPWLGGPLAGLAAMGAGAAWLASSSAVAVPEQLSRPGLVRDALLTWADQLDLSPRRLRGAVAALLVSAADTGHGAQQLRDLLALEADLPSAVRATMLTAADSLDLSPRRLRTALFALLNAAIASGLDDEQFKALLLAPGGGADA